MSSRLLTRPKRNCKQGKKGRAKQQETHQDPMEDYWNLGPQTMQECGLVQAEHECHRASRVALRMYGSLNVLLLKRSLLLIILTPQCNVIALCAEEVALAAAPFRTARDSQYVQLV